jgi:hypothetical protein
MVTSERAFPPRCRRGPAGRPGRGTDADLSESADREIWLRSTMPEGQEGLVPALRFNPWRRARRKTRCSSAEALDCRAPSATQPCCGRPPATVASPTNRGVTPEHRLGKPASSPTKKLGCREGGPGGAIPATDAPTNPNFSSGCADASCENRRCSGRANPPLRPASDGRESLGKEAARRNLRSLFRSGDGRGGSSSEAPPVRRVMGISEERRRMGRWRHR